MLVRLIFDGIGWSREYVVVKLVDGLGKYAKFVKLLYLVDGFCYGFVLLLFFIF